MTKKNRSGRPRKTKRRGMSAKKRRAGSSRASPDRAAVLGYLTGLSEPQLISLVEEARVLRRTRAHEEAERLAAKTSDKFYSTQHLEEAIKLLDSLDGALMGWAKDYFRITHPPYTAGRAFVTNCKGILEDFKARPVHELTKEDLFKQITDKTETETTLDSYQRGLTMEEYAKLIEDEVGAMDKWIKANKRDGALAIPSAELALKLVNWLTTIKL